MFRFLKNNKQYIVIDAGSHKIAAIAFQILDNKPFINQIEYHKSKGIKNNHLIDINAFSSVVAGEKVLDSIASPAIAIFGFSLFKEQPFIIIRNKKINL